MSRFSTLPPSMSRRSILLATTMCAVIVSGAADQASAHGGFGGGTAGSSFGHAAPSAGRAFAASGSMRAPFRPVATLRPFHVAPGRHVASGASFPLGHPQRSAQARRPNWYVPWQHPYNGGTNNESAPGVAGTAAQGGGAPEQSSPAPHSSGVDGPERGGIPTDPPYWWQQLLNGRRIAFENSDSTDALGPGPNTGTQNAPPYWWQQLLNGRFIAFGSITRPTTAGAVAAAGRVAAVNQAGQTTGAPNVVANGTVFGHDGQPASATGLGSSSGASQLNTPGGQTGQQQDPGTGSSLGGAASLNNTASDNSSQGDIDAAAAVFNKLAGQGIDLIDQAMQGGVNGLNIPSQANAGAVSEDTSATYTKVTNSGGTITTPNGVTVTGGDTTLTFVTSNTTGSAPASSNGSGSNSTGGTAVAIPEIVVTPEPGDQGQTGGSSATPATGSGGSAGVAETSAAAAGTGAAPTYGLGALIGRILKGGPDPDPTDSGATTNPAGGLATNSPVSRTGQAGGTGNNTETNGGATGGLAAGTSLSSKGHGDGGGNDAGDNNRIGKGGTLASGSSLTSKDQGDGGGSDTRGGGGTSTVTGSRKVVGAGGGHNQLSGSVAATN